MGKIESPYPTFNGMHNKPKKEYILTTPGRIILNKILQDSLTFST